MNIDQWIDKISEVYQLNNKVFTQDKKICLLKKVDSYDDVSLEQANVALELYDIMKRYFFRKVINGETFGDISRFSEKFGTSIEKNYGGILRGPFIDLARTYWTYRFEVFDLFPYRELLLVQILQRIEFEVRALFFPTPGPYQTPIEIRIEAIRETLKEYAPEFDIEGFLSCNPVLGLHGKEKRWGCLLGIILIVIFLIGFLTFFLICQ